MEFTKNHSERAQVLQEHVAMQAREWKRKVAALDWLEENNGETDCLPYDTAYKWVVKGLRGSTGMGPTLLQAIEAAMKKG